VTDSLGIPVARLSGRLDPNDLSVQQLLGERAADWLRAAGATTAIAYASHPENLVPSSGQHQAGTCRMGTDPATSVTDPCGRVWGHPNFRVIDGSLHVTNGGVNPVLTIFVKRSGSCIPGWGRVATTFSSHPIIRGGSPWERRTRLPTLGSSHDQGLLCWRHRLDSSADRGCDRRGG
jgi:hypothetical protein